MPWGNKFPDMKNDPSYLEGRLSNAETSLAEKAQQTDFLSLQTKVNGMGSGSPKGVYSSLSALQTAFPSGDNNVYVINGNNGAQEVDSLNVTSTPTTSGNVTVTLNGVSANIAVIAGVAEVASLNITAPPTAAGFVSVYLNGVGTNINVDSTTYPTATALATAIRNTSFVGWTTGGTGTTVTFTSNAVGSKTDASFIVGSTGVTGTMTTTTQGSGDDATGVATKIRNTVYSGWTTGGTGSTVTFTANASGTMATPSYSAGSTGATGTMSVTTIGQPSYTSNWYYWNGSSWVNGGAYQAVVIQDKSVMPNKTNFIEEVPSNYVDVTKLTDGYLNSTGGFSSSVNASVSDYIPVVYGKTYIAKINNGGSWGSWFYNSSKTGTNEITLNADGSFTVTDHNVSYVRLVFYPKPTDNLQMMMVDGTLYPTNYTPYGGNLINISDSRFQDTISKVFKMSNSLYGLKWNAMGDSITFGLNATKPYHGCIADRTAIVNRNYGVSGSSIAIRNGRTDSMVERYSSMATDADIVTVLGGVNDSNNNVPMGDMSSRDSTTFYGACHNLFSGLINQYQGKKIGVITPMQYAQKTYVDALTTVAHYYSLPVLDLYNESSLSTQIPAIVTNYIPDTLHPNDAGHQVISRTIEAFLRRL